MVLRPRTVLILIFQFATDNPLQKFLQIPSITMETTVINTLIATAILAGGAIAEYSTNANNDAEALMRERQPSHRTVAARGDGLNKLVNGTRNSTDANLLTTKSLKTCCEWSWTTSTCKGFGYVQRNWGRGVYTECTHIADSNLVV
ncbi:hypothetical protein PHYPSEUDO_005765 [Phytophthora pseudosyringae]|uniref:Uncharacterized protein n=1 Tax=Phytophthora pseudosyringae TaxID=221518 RepID=A0A8T1VL68_9STRA|nr:hypothetical protein PHYPSEUDO_005765 [Phytophthora pseudosyringae]